MLCKIIIPPYEIHKLPSVPKTFEELNKSVLSKIKGQPPENYVLKYKDSDDEFITLADEEDLKTAITTSAADQLKTLRVYFVKENAPLSPNMYNSHLNLSSSQWGLQNESFMQPGSRSNRMSSSLFPAAQEKKFFGGFESFGDSGLNRTNVEDQKGGVPQRRFSKSNSLMVDGSRRENPFDNRSSMGRSVFLDDRGNQMEGDAGGRLNPDFLEAINEAFESKLKEKIEQKVQTIVADTMSKLKVEPAPRSAKKYPFGSTPFSMKNSIAQFDSSRTSIQRAKEIAQGREDLNCINCGKKIEGVKYSCLECQNCDFCETCEEKYGHPHPLLKTRIPKGVLKNSEEDGERKPSNSVESVNIEKENRSEIHSRPSNAAAERSSNLSQSAVSAKSHYATPGGATPGGGKEAKKYRMTFVKRPKYDVYLVNSGKQYSVEFTVQNVGEKEWPDDVVFACLEGVHKGEERGLPALVTGQSHEMKLDLVAPETPGAYLSVWKVQYSQDGEKVQFGSNLYIEINVKEERVSEKRQKKEKEREIIEYAKPLQEPKPVEHAKIEPVEDLKIQREDSKKKSEKRVAFVEKNYGEDVVKRHEEEKPKKSASAQSGSQAISFTEDQEKYVQELESLFPDEPRAALVEFVSECPIHLGLDEIVTLFLKQKGVIDMMY